ncbi:MAG TPA: PQQ-dependent sugar dehydrogenase [Hyphomicrobiaceae bacterium]|jgi:glucose/arabinose dehydrogenase|nr:PQQ-dependent sugar dehydrogenase [Hyphomicrobiaceae bacterium]
MKRRAVTIRRRKAESREGSRARQRTPGSVIARAKTVILLTLLAVLGCAAPAAAQNLGLQPVVDGLTAPLHLEEPADGSGRKFIVQQHGVVAVLGPDGQLLPEPFLDLRSRLLPLEQNFEERGLLGFALHPEFARNGRLFATYSAPLRPGAPERWNYTRRVSEFSAEPGNLAKIDAASERVLLEIDWPSRKHNGGGLTFGPDGFLYIGLGDGGISHGIGKKVLWEAFEVAAPALTWDGLAQDTESLFGKILRIDVDHGFPGYAIPRDNPFASGSGKKEIWAWGFRNPFRIAFDRQDGGLFVTAVAETLWEAAYRVKGPGNFGWPLLEGMHCVDRLKPRQPPPTCPARDDPGNGMVLPVLEYPNMQASHPETKLGVAGVGTAITGARIYRGAAIPALAGKLVVSDWSAAFKQPSGQIFIADPSSDSGQLWPYRRALQIDSRIISLAEDRAGEIYVLTNETLGPYGATGKVLRLVVRP